MIDEAKREAEAIALVDMDGTIADFDKAMKRELASLRSPGEDPANDETLYEELPHMKARRRVIKKIPGFWRNLEVVDAGMQVVQMLQGLEFKCQILSKAPRKAPQAAAEKIEWCVAHVPHMPIILSEDKGLVYGKVLVDDWPEYVERWIQWRPRGLVVAVAQPWNVDIEKLSPNVIRYTGKNYHELTKRLEAARITVGDELALQLSGRLASVRATAGD